MPDLHGKTADGRTVDSTLLYLPLYDMAYGERRMPSSNSIDLIMCFLGASHSQGSQAGDFVDDSGPPKSTQPTRGLPVVVVTTRTKFDSSSSA